jgi:hypothetical protein
MSDPAITIVTPPFNEAHSLRATIESVPGEDDPALE